VAGWLVDPACRPLGLAAGRRVLDESALAVALRAWRDGPASDWPAWAALLAATGDPAAAPALVDLHASDPGLSPVHRALFEGIVGWALERG
jgi:hypothetical protein